MTDYAGLVERLRKYGDDWRIANVHWAYDAADAIEALEAENKKLREAAKVGIHLAAADEALSEEVTKLREAMKDLLADFDEYGNVGKHWDSVVRVREALGNEQEYARKLLGGREDG
jgi:hypothetical protein